MMIKVHVYLRLHTASVKSTAGNKSRLFLTPFHISTSSSLTFAEAFRNDHVAACRTALRSAAEENESDGHVTVPCPFKLTLQNSILDWLKLWWRQQIGYDGTHSEQAFTFEVTLCNSSYNRYWKLVDIVNLNIKYCTSQLKTSIYVKISWFGYTNNT